MIAEVLDDVLTFGREGFPLFIVAGVLTGAVLGVDQLYEMIQTDVNRRRYRLVLIVTASLLCLVALLAIIVEATGVLDVAGPDTLDALTSAPPLLISDELLGLARRVLQVLAETLVGAYLMIDVAETCRAHRGGLKPHEIPNPEVRNKRRHIHALRKDIRSRQTGLRQLQLMERRYRAARRRYIKKGQLMFRARYEQARPAHF